MDFKVLVDKTSYLYYNDKLYQNGYLRLYRVENVQKIQFYSADLCKKSIDFVKKVVFIAQRNGRGAF